MHYRIGIENNIEGRSLAWVLGHPGCFRYGSDASGARAEVATSIREYGAWVAGHLPGSSWIEVDDIDVRLAGTWECFTIDESYELAEGGYEINAWFLDDWRPLAAVDVERGLLLLSWSRSDLLDVVGHLSPRQLQMSHPGERWSIAGILGHVGSAEWWYLDRLGLAMPRERLPEDPFARLDAVRQELAQALGRLVGDRRVVGIEGEFWSPRKLLRRAVWHERDHAEHVCRLLAGPGE